ncbi:MAG TPA: hypothetical protein VFG30_44800 [Polyangiales bacterium]|nr:hypothetical protein [Polyangiales bacterium]
MNSALLATTKSSAPDPAESRSQKHHTQSKWRLRKVISSNSKSILRANKFGASKRNASSSVETIN